MISSESIYNSDFYKEKFSKLLSLLEINFKDLNLYILSFIHRSIINEKPELKDHNERLEFLGDAVLELVITEKLYKDFPEKPEGELTDIRSALVRGRNLAIVSKSLNFQDYLFLGKGEHLSGGRENDYLLANSMESFIGAIYLDLGLERVVEFIYKYIYSTLGEILENRLYKDYKSLIQEFSQAKYNITPAYQVLSEAGPDHNKIFSCGVFLDASLVGTGEGSSKKKAQEKARENAYNSRESWQVFN